VECNRRTRIEKDGPRWHENPARAIPVRAEVAIALERLDSIGARLWLAFILPWRVLFDPAFAGQVARLRTGAPELPPAEPKPEPEIAATEPEPERDDTPALQLLAIMQREGRFIDFLQEDVAGFSDADVGAAARVVHEGCNRALKDYLELAPVRKEAEDDEVVLEPGFDAKRTRLTGNVVGEPPFKGRLAHHGWMVTRIRLPDLTDGHDPRVVAPAEVEL
jgi:hypothetical protein